MDQRKEHRINLAGWWLFVVSALFFIGASLRAGDALGLLGSLFFLIACFVFLVPDALRARAAKSDRGRGLTPLSLAPRRSTRGRA